MFNQSRLKLICFKKIRSALEDFEGRARVPESEGSTEGPGAGVEGIQGAHHSLHMESSEGGGPHTALCAPQGIFTWDGRYDQPQPHFARGKLKPRRVSNLPKVTQHVCGSLHGRLQVLSVGSGHFIHALPPWPELLPSRLTQSAG